MAFSFLTHRSKSKPSNVKNERDGQSNLNESSSHHDEKSHSATISTPVPLIFPSQRSSLDPNLPLPIPIHSIPSRASLSPDPEKSSEPSIDISLNSPYPQVRAAVRNTGI
ncbi:hypothetical protein OCU04_002768 [Sclerotinia nivalis]|uniref:Uncharacterized protein n=1 Tax=Sclerotinia nivalis TaxID=352851 RepID=A0A9X0AUF8_9HELO|nr:hypothetical protein OCU04_002768 [Sclerotinia nivalis]